MGRMANVIAKWIPVLLLALVVQSWIYPGAGKAEEAPKNILVINSYHTGFPWTEDQTEGFLEEIRSSGIPFSYSVEYLDWKHYPTGQNLANFRDNLKYKYSGVPLDLVLCTDDAALEFAMDHRKDILNDAPIVFSGVNRLSLSNLVRDSRNTAGIIEDVDPTETIKLALTVNPSLTTVQLLYDNSESGASTGKLVAEEIESRFPSLEVVPLNNLSYEQLLGYVHTLPSDHIVLMTTYSSDGLGRTLEFTDAADAVSRSSSVPVYHTYDFSLGHGAFGGSMLSGSIQGKSAAQLGIKMLKGTHTEGHDYYPQHTLRTVLDYEQLKRFRIPLPSIPEGIEIINRPTSFYQDHLVLVWSTASAFAALIAFIALLIYYITRIRRVEKSLARSEERFRLAANGSHAVIWDVDLETNRYFFSDSWYELLGYSRGELNETSGGWRTIVHPEDSAIVDQAIKDHLQGKTVYFQCEIRFKAKNGEFEWFEARAKAMAGLESERRFIRFAGSLIHITDRKEYELKLYNSYQELETTYEELTATQEELQENYDAMVENQTELHRLAYYDSLSGMPNRVSLLEQLDEWMQNNRNKPISILFLDIDNFKFVNDTLGHTAGDELIRKVSERLCLLADKEDTLFRLSGDEFVVLVKQAPRDTAAYASALIEGFKDPIGIKDTDLYVSISIGIACYPRDGMDREELLKNADIAMHKAKENGKGRALEYNPSMVEDFNSRLIIETHLRGALRNEEFMLYYQPQVHLESGSITGFEALIRWNSPALGFVSPLAFIKVAEDCRLIGPIGEWVLRKACSFLKELHSGGYPACTISVNVSVIQLIQDHFVETVMAVLQEAGLSPEFLELEITESIFMESYEKAIEKLHILKASGVRIALDDFGTGYSSLSYLMQLPITTLKIDKSFVDRVPGSKGDKSLTEAIIMIGHRIGLEVVAEGVETDDQLDYLKRSSCDFVQGYRISKPIPGQDVLPFMEKYGVPTRTKQEE